MRQPVWVHYIGLSYEIRQQTPVNRLGGATGTAVTVLHQQQRMQQKHAPPVLSLSARMQTTLQ